jgi:glutamate synthase (NADPH/NADH) small chain
LPGVYSANEFLTRVNLMHADQFPHYDEPVFDCRERNVAVIGGGNTAIDAVRTALRLGASRAMLIYRRGELEMPARREEIEHARQELVEFHLLTQPIEFLAAANGRLKAIRCVQMELGQADADGRRVAVPKAGAEVDLPVDLAVVALGTGPNPLVQSSSPNLKTTHNGYIAADADTLQTSLPGVFAAGDIVTGGATVILAMGAGRKAAAAIDLYLHTLPTADEVKVQANHD